MVTMFIEEKLVSLIFHEASEAPAAAEDRSIQNTFSF
jgi:hypothetical protein